MSIQWNRGILISSERKIEDVDGDHGTARSTCRTTHVSTDGNPGSIR